MMVAMKIIRNYEATEEADRNRREDIEYVGAKQGNDFHWKSKGKDPESKITVVIQDRAAWVRSVYTRSLYVEYGMGVHCTKILTGT